MRRGHSLVILPLLVILILGMLAACGSAHEGRSSGQEGGEQTAGLNGQGRHGDRQSGEQLFDLSGKLDEISWLNEEERIDLQCLRESYPAVAGLVMDKDACLHLVTVDGQRMVYKRPEGCKANVVEADIATSMAQPYPLEPARPATPPGIAPGRQRSRELLTAIYGQPRGISSSLRTVGLLGRGISLAEPAATAFAPVAKKLHALAQARPEIARWLKSDGGYCYRKIAGENRLSGHSYGIALDLSAHLAAYWRWSRQRPHPQQNSYPGEIVSVFEEAGFVWGGKWHEYDIMHFEYRPELICKARILANIQASQIEHGQTGRNATSGHTDKF